MLADYPLHRTASYNCHHKSTTGMMLETEGLVMGGNDSYSVQYRVLLIFRDSSNSRIRALNSVVWLEVSSSSAVHLTSHLFVRNPNVHSLFTSPLAATLSHFNLAHVFIHGPGSVVGIATGYGLDGPGIESRWEARFSAPVQIGTGAHPSSCTMGTRSFPGVKSGRGVTLTPHPLLVPWS